MTNKAEEIRCPVCSVIITNPVVNPQNSSLGGWVECQNCKAHFHQLNLSSEVFRQTVKEGYIQDLQIKVQKGQEAAKILEIINKSLTAP